MKKSIIAILITSSLSLNATAASSQSDLPEAGIKNGEEITSSTTTNESNQVVQDSSPKASTKEMQDMSDPMAVFTQAGVGVTNKGINLKIGQTYDTGNDATMGMNVIEIKGIGGEALGWSDDNLRNDSVDSVRFRNFTVDLNKGLGAQVDINYNFNSGAGMATYSLMQALPKFGPFQLFPLAGLGVAVQDQSKISKPEAEYDGYTAPGAIALLGMYAKITISDNIWLNYNPMYISGLSGELGDESVMAHEIVASYQLNQTQNIRLFINFNNAGKDQGKDDNYRWEEINDSGSIRLEFNQQF